MEGPRQRAVAAELHHHHYRTTDVKELMAPVHDRMPIILHPSDFRPRVRPGAAAFPCRRDGSLRGRERSRQRKEQWHRVAEQQVNNTYPNSRLQ